MSWNICGWTNENKWMREEVILGLKCNIIVLQETHLKKDDILNVPGYFCDKRFFHNRQSNHIRARKSYGGVAILFDYDFMTNYHVELVDKSYDGLLLVKCEHKLSAHTIIIAGCYLPPEMSIWGRDATGFYSHLLQFVYQYQDVDAFYICGDLNSRIGKKCDYIPDIDNLSERTVIDFVQNSHGAALHDFLLESRFCIVNGRIKPEQNNFTFIHSRGRSVVDYFLVPIDCLTCCEDFEVLPPGVLLQKFCSSNITRMSGAVFDHSVLKLTMSCSVIIQTENNDHPTYENMNYNCLSQDSVFFKRYKIETIPDDFLSSPSTCAAMLDLIEETERSMNNQQVIDNIYEKMCGIYHGEMSKYFKSTNIYPSARKRSFKRCKPFWNEQLKDLWETLRNAEKEFIKSKGTNVIEARQNFKQAQYVFDKTYRREKRRFERAQLNDIENAVSNDPKQFWSLLKGLGPHKKVVIPNEVYDDVGNINTDIKFVTNKWRTEFEKLFSSPPTDGDFDQNFYNDCCNALNELERDTVNLPGLNHEISEDEIRKVIKSSKNKKAVGIDNLPNEVFKNDKSVSLLIALFKKVFEFGLLPNVWNKALIKPIPKSSTIDPRIPLEYRGISLISTVYKLYSSLLNSRLTSVLEQQDLIADEQNGFRRKRSCEDHCFVLSSIVRNRKALNKSTFVGLVDFKKAFDCVDRRLLFYKLLKAGVNGNIYKSIKNIYSFCESAVNINGHISEFFNCDYGVRQGDCLSSTLFLVYINDLVTELKEKSVGIQNDYFSVQCLLYADDLTLISESEDDLQTMFNVLADWCSKWRMSVNTSKTAVMHFRNSRIKRTQFRFKFRLSEIKIVETYKYLGLIFHEHLDFNVTSKVLADSGGRALGALYSKYKSNNGFGFKTYTKLYHSGVAPIIDYNSSIWGFGEHDCINSIQNRAIRLYLGLHRFAPNCAINGDMGWAPSKIRRHSNIIRFWNRIVNIDENRLTKKVFRWDKSFKHVNWCYELALMLNTVSMFDSFTEECPINVKVIKEKLLELYKNDWRIKVEATPKLRTYFTYKETYCCEPFTKIINNRSYRSITAQFRCGILPLAIETGRYNNIPIEFRLCNYCNENVIEDESHFLLYCPVYDEFRNSLFSKAFDNNENFVNMSNSMKFKLLMSRDMIRFTAEFLHKAYEKRRSLTYVTN